MFDSALAISAAGLVIVVIVHLIKTGRWMGQQESQQKQHHAALFDSDGTPKTESMRSDIVWIRAKLGNGLLVDVECLKRDIRVMEGKLSSLEARVGGRRKENGVHGEYD